MDNFDAGKSEKRFFSKERWKNFVSGKFFNQYLPWLLPLVAFILLGLFMALKVDYLVDSDMASELVLSKLLSEEIGLLSKNWYYSTEIRVLNTQIIFTPLFWIFQDWHTVRVVGSIILFLIYALCFIFFCFSAKLGKYAPYLTTLLLIPFSPSYHTYVLYGTYYVPHICVSLVCLALSLRIYKTSSNRNRIIMAVIMGVLSLFAGMGGLRQLCILYLPFFCSSFILWVVKRDKDKLFIFLSAALGLLSSLIGFCINAALLSRKYSFLSWSVGYIDPSLDRFWLCFIDLFKSFGYTNGNVLSSASFYNVVSLGVWVFVILSAIFTYKNKEADLEDLQVCTFLLCSLAVFIVLYTVTNVSYVQRYNLPIVVFCIPVLAIGFKNVPWKKVYQYSLYGALFCCVFVCSSMTYVSYFKAQRASTRQEMVDVLCENGYQYGYASFWNANVLTELSNGQLELYTWTSVVDGIKNPCATFNWLQEKNHSGLISHEKLFVALTEDEYKDGAVQGFFDENHIIYRGNGHVAFGYNSEEYYRAYQSYEYDLLSENSLINGYIADGKRYVQPTGTSFGPYIVLLAGTYRVTVTGENLDLCEFDCVSQGVSAVETTTTVCQSDKIEYTFTLSELTSGIEFRIFNNSEQEIALSSLNVHLQEVVS